MKARPCVLKFWMGVALLSLMISMPVSAFTYHYSSDSVVSNNGVTKHYNAFLSNQSFRVEAKNITTAQCKAVFGENATAYDNSFGISGVNSSVAVDDVFGGWILAYNLTFPNYFGRVSPPYEGYNTIWPSITTAAHSHMYSNQKYYIFPANTVKIVTRSDLCTNSQPTDPNSFVSDGTNKSANHVVWWDLIQDIYYSTDIPMPSAEVNFIGSPLDGYSPLVVQYTVLNFSYVNSTGTLWTFGDGQTATSTISTINHTYQNPGIYSVSMGYYNTSGVYDTITKNNYVLASTPTGMIVNLDVKNAITGALIQDSTVSIRNTTTGVWRNTTAPTGLVYFSTTDPGYLYPLSQNQSITLAANKSGYFPAAATFNIPYTNYLKQLFLMPTSIVNATGTGTVVVTVIRDKDDYFEPGISVVMDSGQIGVTNVAGAVTLFNVTAGDRVVKVTDPDGDYLSTEKSFTLVAGETKLLVMRIVRTGETPVITPVSPVPTVTGTYDPDDPNSPGYGNYTATQVNQAGSEGIVQMLGQLIALWPLIVLGIFMKFMKSAFT